MNTSSPMRAGTGRTEGTPNYYFPGAVDEVRIWNYARSASQINDNKNINLAVPQSGLMSYYQFEDGSATSKTGSINGALMNFPNAVTGVSLIDLSSNADLSALTISAGTLSPSFVSGTIGYTVSVSNATRSITVTPTKLDANASIQAQVNDGGYATIISGSSDSTLSLNEGINTVDVKVTAQDGSTLKTYTMEVTRGDVSTISNFNDQAKYYFDGSYAITAPTTSSTGAFSYSSNNTAVATIDGTTVTIVGTGIATITATQAGDATYNSGSIISVLTVAAVSVLTKNGGISTTNFDYVNKNGLAIQTKSDVIIKNGLVLHLDAGNVASYSGTGTTWTDLSGNGNNGTLKNGVGYNSDNEGSLVFDGVNDYFVTNNNLDLSSTDKLTIQIILKTASSNVEMVLEHSVNWNHHNSFGVVLNNQNNKIQTVDHNQKYNVSNSAVSINNDNWSLFSTTIDRSLGAADQNLIYINGDTANKVNVSNLLFDNSLNFDSHKLYLSSRGGIAYYFNCAIAQVLIYNRVLTAAEILQNFNVVRLKYGL